MSKIKKPIQPKLSAANLSPFSGYLQTEELIVNQLIQEQDFSYDEVRATGFQTCQISKTNFSGCQLNSFEAQDVIFEHCDFSNAVMIGGSFHRVIFKNCKLTGTNFAESLLKDCQFIECVNDFSSYSYSNLKIVHFQECSLKDSDLHELRWQHLQLTNCGLTGSSWFNTELAGLNLATCHFDKIALSQELIKGLVVNQEQAIVIALGFGLIIDEPI